jgi:Holliday junction resolvase-like predicted endonuclease
MGINKSSRHQKIIGNFGENLICNWLSRSGFEVVVVDHTGIDIIAKSPSAKQKKPYGITVKSRTRVKSKEEEAVNVLSYKKKDLDKKNDLEKLEAACEAFGCDPWIAIYVETEEYADVYLTSLKHYKNKYCGKEERVVDIWKMSEEVKQQYDKDSKVKHVRFKFNATNWSWQR